MRLHGPVFTNLLCCASIPYRNSTTAHTTNVMAYIFFFLINAFYYIAFYIECHNISYLKLSHRTPGFNIWGECLPRTSAGFCYSVTDVCSRSRYASKLNLRYISNGVLHVLNQLTSDYFPDIFPVRIECFCMPNHPAAVQALCPSSALLCPPEIRRILWSQVHVIGSTAWWFFETSNSKTCTISSSIWCLERLNDVKNVE